MIYVKKYERWTLVRAYTQKYQQAEKKDKSFILNSLSNLTGYHRKYLMNILAHPPGLQLKPLIRDRKLSYESVLPLLKKLWTISNFACGKRLVPAIPIYLEALARHKELRVNKEEKKLLLKISPATVDRMLKRAKKAISLKGRSKTKPGTLLKNQIPIHTFADWDEAKPGFLEIDLVHHCGNSTFGEYIYTLDTCDVATGWNECAAFLGKLRKHTVEATDKIRERLPFPLLGVDFDTGGEFVNWHFIWYCQNKNITYTRAREGRKNDQAYIEQQNYSVVRRFVGYSRIDTKEQLEILNHLYELLSDYQNFFQPVMRLKEKRRDGAKVTRRYDKPKTPYERVLEHKEIKTSVKRELRKRFLKLNPKILLVNITTLGRQLSKR